MTDSAIDMTASSEHGGEHTESPPDDHLNRIGHTLPLVLLALAVLAYALYFSYLTVVRYAAFESRALDMGNLVQAIWNTSQGNWFHLTNQPGIVNRLSLHVEPIILPIAGLFRLYSRPELLLVLQAVIIALGALPAFALGRLKLKNDWMALIFAVAFLLHPSIQAANWLEFHPVALAPTFLLAAFYFLFAGRVGWYAFFAVLAVSCKEDIPLLVFMIGLYAWLALGKRRVGLITMLLSLAWALFAVLYVQDAFGGGNIHWGRYAYLGETPGEMVRSLLTRPDLVLAQLRQAEPLRYLLLLTLPVAFSSFLAPEILFLALPSLGINLLADFAPMHQVDELIYAAPIVPFVIVAGIAGVARLGRWLNGATWFASSPAARRLWLPLVGAAILGCLLIAQLNFGYLPGGDNYRRFTVTDHHRRAATIIAQIPPDAALSVQDKLNPHVSQRETLYIFPRIEDADMVFLDVTGPAWPQHPNDVRAAVDDLLAGGFGIVAAEDGYLLLGRDAPALEIPPPFYDSWRVEEQQGGSGPLLTFDETIELIDFDVVQDQHGEVVTETVWRALKPLPDDLRFYVGYLDSAGNVMADTLFYPPVASLWYPTPLWEPGDLVRVKTLPRTLDAERFTLAVGLYRGEDGWQAGERLAVETDSTDSTDVALLEGRTLARLGGYARDGDHWQRVEAADRSTISPLAAQFGDIIHLTGAEVDAEALSPGEPLGFVLQWQTAEPVPFDYSLFVHLLDEAGNNMAQLDWQPRDLLGPLPMTTWPVGRPIVDEETLALPHELPAGEYQLVVGVYDWRDGRRLPATGDNVLAGDVVNIAHITVQ